MKRPDDQKTAFEVACPVCARQPGEVCVGLPAGSFHAQRVEAASFISSLRPGVSPPSLEDFDQAVLRRLGM